MPERLEVHDLCFVFSPERAFASERSGKKAPAADQDKERKVIISMSSMCLSQRTHFSLAHHHTLSTLLSPAGNLGCFTKTQQLREQRSLFLSVCSIFGCPDNSVFGILNMHADVNAGSCTQGLEQLLGFVHNTK